MKSLLFGHNDYSISLLTDEEFVQYKSQIPIIEDWWWLKPQTIVNQKNDDDKSDIGVIKFVNLEGDKNDLGWEPFYRIGVRPVIRFSFKDVTQGDVFAALGNRWIVLDEGFAISVDTICHKRIDGSAAYWEKILKTKENRVCELKMWLEDWAKAGENYD